MFKRIPWLGLAAPAFLVVALTTAAPGHAGVLDCIEVVAPAKPLADAVEAAASAAQCAGQAASGDAVMIAAIGAVTALRVGGAFSNTAECMGVIDSMIGKTVAQALLELGLADVLLTGLSAAQKNAINNQMQQVVEGKLSFTQLANSAPVLQPLLNYVTCGCQIAGLDGEINNIANAYKDNVNGCIDFASDAVEFVGDVIESGAEAFAEGLKTLGHLFEGALEAGWNAVTSCFGLCGDDDEPDCAPNTGVPKSLFGQWSTKKISQINTGCGSWFCDQGGILKTKKGPEGKILYTCSHCYGAWALNSQGTCAPCGGTVKKISAHMCLQKEESYPTDDGSTCIKVPPAMESCCEPGQQMKPAKGWNGGVPDCSKGVIGGDCSNAAVASTQCVGACFPPQYFDTGTGLCTDCHFNSVPVYDSDRSKNSIGHCKQCPPGLTGEANLTCQPCPPGLLIWSLTPPKKQGGVATQTQFEPTDTVARPPPPQKRPGAGTVSPLPGGPIGLVEGGKCVGCPEHWYPVYYSDPTKSSFGYCKECPPGHYLAKTTEAPPKDPITGKWLAMPKLPECLPCAAGFDPKHPHVCLPPNVAKPMPGAISHVPGQKGCPPGTQLVDGACGPPSSTLVPRRRLICPPGQLPNATRTACITITRKQPDGRVISKVPTGQTAAAAKRRPSQWLAKRRPVPPTKAIPIPR